MLAQKILISVQRSFYGTVEVFCGSAAKSTQFQVFQRLYTRIDLNTMEDESHLELIKRVKFQGGRKQTGRRFSFDQSIKWWNFNVFQ